MKNAERASNESNPRIHCFALPRPIIGQKKTGHTHRNSATIALNEQWKEMVALS